MATGTLGGETQRRVTEETPKDVGDPDHTNPVGVGVGVKGYVEDERL